MTYGTYFIVTYVTEHTHFDPDCDFFFFLHTIPQDHTGITPRQFPHSHSVKSVSHYAGKYEQTHKENIKKKKKKNHLTQMGKPTRKSQGPARILPQSIVSVFVVVIYEFSLFFSVILSDDVKACPE